MNTNQETAVPTVAICIPTYNQAAYLSKSIASALAQTYPSVEVWVSDDCSTDTTPEVVQRLQQEFPDLRYHRQERNLGISSNNNWLLSQPKTEFIVRLDSDDLLHPHYVEKLVPLLEKNPQAGYAHCAVQEIDDRDEPRRVRRLGRRGEYQNAEESLRASAWGYRVAANICMFRREVLEQTNFYRAEVVYTQDWDLAVRIADAGWGNVYGDDVLASYRSWGDAANIRSKRKYDEIEGCVQIFDESLQPAFQKRGWSLTPINKSRKSMALGYAVVLDAPYFSPEECRSLIEVLKRLGNSPQLSLQMKMSQLGLGFVIRLKYRLRLALRDLAKAIIGRISAFRS